MIADIIFEKCMKTFQKQTLRGVLQKMCSLGSKLTLSWELLKGKYDRVKSSKINIMEFAFSKVAALGLYLYNTFFEKKKKSYSGKRIFSLK